MEGIMFGLFVVGLIFRLSGRNAFGREY